MTRDARKIYNSLSKYFGLRARDTFLNPLQPDRFDSAATNNTLKDRFLEHQGYVRIQKLDKATGHHFNLPGHSLSDMHITALEHVNHHGKIREKHYIKLGNT